MQVGEWQRMLASRFAQQSKLWCCEEFLYDLFSSRLAGGPVATSRLQSAARAGRGMVPTISMYTPDTPGRSSLARLRHLIANAAQGHRLGSALPCPAG
jgi:hypothetical protein